MGARAVCGLHGTLQQAKNKAAAVGTSAMQQAEGGAYLGQLHKAHQLLLPEAANGAVAGEGHVGPASQQQAKGGALPGGLCMGNVRPAAIRERWAAWDTSHQQQADNGAAAGGHSRQPSNRPRAARCGGGCNGHISPAASRQRGGSGGTLMSAQQKAEGKFLSLVLGQLQETGH